MGESTGSVNWGRRGYDWGSMHKSAPADRNMTAIGGGKAAGRARGLRIGGRNTRIEVANTTSQRGEDLEFGAREGSSVGSLRNRWRKSAEEEGCKCWRKMAGPRLRRRTEGRDKEDRSGWGWDWEWDSGFVENVGGGSKGWRRNRRCAL